MELINKLLGSTANNPRFDRRYIDKTFWALFLVLIVISLIALSSATSTLVFTDDSILGPIGHQFIFILIGVVCAWFMQFMPSWLIRMIAYGAWGIMVLILLSMLIPHNPFVVTLNGAGRWFKLGIAFQPSEFAKLGMVIVVADLLSRAKTPEQMRKAFYYSLGAAAITILPIMVGNLSTAVLMGGVVLLIWIIAGVDWRQWGAALLIAITVLVSGYFIVEYAFIKPGRKLPGLLSRATTWVSRIDDMFEEKRSKKEGDPYVINDDNYQRSLAKVAVARGGLSPIGVLPGNSQERDYLPLPYADYIFAIIVEETGIVGAVFLIFVYLAILFRACYVSARYEDHGAMVMMMGMALMIVCQALISMAVSVGLGPVTGQQLPMISKGGTSTVATALYFGVMMAVSREQNQITGMQKNAKSESLDEIPIIDLNQ